MARRKATVEEPSRWEMNDKESRYVHFGETEVRVAVARANTGIMAVFMEAGMSEFATPGEARELGQALIDIAETVERERKG